MLIEHIFATIQLISNKSRRGVLKVSQIATAVKAASLDFYNDELKTYQQTGVIPTSLKTFVKTVAVTITSGQGTLPADFVREIVFVTDCGAEGDFVTPESFSDRMKSSIIQPTKELPIAKIQDGKIIVEPDETATVNLTYFREPAAFLWNYTVDMDGRGLTFAATGGVVAPAPPGDSIDIEFNADDSGSIIKRALTYLGVAFQNAGALQLGMTEIQEANSR